MSSSPPTEAPVLAGPISLEEFLSWGVTDVQYELVDGWVVVNPAPGPGHQQVVTNLFRLLLGARPAGHEVLTAPLDWVLSSDPPRVRQPDVVLVALPAVLPLTSPPLLVVEVLSPGGHERDLVTKRLEYAAAGLRHYWVIDPQAPAVVIFAGDELHEVARSSGDTPIGVAQPVTAAVVPSALVAPPT